MDGFGQTMGVPREQETQQQRVEREQVQKEYRGALIKMILTIFGFVVVMFVGMMVVMFGAMAMGFGLVTVLMPIIAIVVAIPFGLWFIRSSIFRNFRKAAIKNAMYSNMQRETMEDMQEAMKTGPAKEQMDDFKNQIKDELREEIREEMRKGNQGY